MKKKSFSILGCGWLGLPLAKSLVKYGHTTKGSTTTAMKHQELHTQHIQPYLLTIENTIDGDIATFLQSDVLFINVPFRKQKNHLSSYQKLVALLEKSSVSHVIFVSSTSVYADTNTIITDTENFNINPDKKELLQLEKLFLNNPYFKTTIIRFAGLIGGTRNPGNFFKADKIVPNALAPTNLIHLEDCIGIVKAIVAQEKWNVTYNAAATTHPTKASYYKKATEQMGKPAATFIEELSTYKIICNKKLVKDLAYTFIYPDLIEGLKAFKN